MDDYQQKFEELDNKLKKLGRPVQPVEKSTPVVEKIIEEEDGFRTQLDERLKKEGIVEVYRKKDGSLMVISISAKEGAFVLSLCVNALLFILLITKIVGIW